MRIGVIGIGAVGGYFGGRLANAGHNVIFVARGATLEAVKNHGLRVESYTGNFTVKKPNLAHDFNSLKNADIILLCVKSYSTREVAKALKSVISERALVVSMQNGVENEDILAEILGQERVIGSVVYITSSTPEPGLIKHTSYGKVIFGELNGDVTDRLRKIEKIFLDSGIPAGVTSEIKKELWTKLMFNIPFNGFTALSGKPLGDNFEIPEAKESFYAALREVQLVAQHEGYNITDEDVETAMNFTKVKEVMNFKSSTLLDIEAGKPVETDALQGAVVKAARKHNLDIPVNRLIYALLKLRY